MRACIQRRILGGGGGGWHGGRAPSLYFAITCFLGGARPPYILQSLVSCSHFEELQTMLFDVELIINNAPLICVYSNTI